MNVKLAQRLVAPDFWTCPHGKRKRPVKAMTYGPEVAELCARAGFAPDAQQELGLDLIFAIRPDGSPASFATCVICCRQNLKTGLFKQTALGWLFVTEEPDMVWSSHEMSTTTEAQLELHELMCDAPFLAKQLPATKNRGCYSDNGSERIELKDGRRLLFKARSKSGGRGLSKTKLILDEAFALRAAMMGSLLPVMLAKPHGQVVYGSSAGKEDAVVLRDIRDRGRAGTSPRLSYLEWGGTPLPSCLDPECEHPKTGLAYGDPCIVNRLEIIEVRNPALSTGRLTIEKLDDLRQELPTDEFLRECIGDWEDPAEEVVDDDELLPSWSLRARPEVEPPEVPVAIGLAVSIDRAWSSIAYAGRLDTGQIYLAASIRARGTGWVAAEAKRLQDKTGCAVAIDGRGPARNLIHELEEAGVWLTVLSTTDALDAVSGMYDDIELVGRELDDDADDPVIHGAFEELDESAAIAVPRDVGDRFLIGRRQSQGDTSMIEGACWARWALITVGGSDIVGGDPDLCDECGKKPHEDPTGQHDYRCTDCREEGDGG